MEAHLDHEEITSTHLGSVVDLDEAVPAVAIVGELDMATEPRVRGALLGRIEQVGVDGVLIADLRRLRFIDASGARALAAAATQLHLRGAGLVIRGAGRMARLVLDHCGIEQVVLALVDAPPVGWSPPPEAEERLRSACIPPEKSEPERRSPARRRVARGAPRIGGPGTPSREHRR